MAFQYFAFLHILQMYSYIRKILEMFQLVLMGLDCDLNNLVLILTGVPTPTRLKKRKLKLEYIGPADPRMFHLNHQIFLIFNAEFYDEHKRLVDSMVCHQMPLIFGCHFHSIFL